MTAEQWEQVKSVFEQALDQPVRKRVSWVQQNCPEDYIRREVISLLEARDYQDDFLEALPHADSGFISDLHPQSMVGERIGSWMLVQEIGQGGMGTVYRAVRADDEFRREVAIKVVARDLDSELLLPRFRTERQILANLEHPYIARLLDGGTTTSGLPYFVMEYVPGLSMTDYCNRNRLPLSERIELFRKVCSAVSYAHHNLIVHRDLKPANILVTEDGTPKLLDFGIARLLNSAGHDASEPTVTMLRMATPAYASPEQIRGQVAGIPSDIYSLGVILYELLTGHRPYRLPSKDSADLARVICEREPTRASLVVGYSETFERSAGDIIMIEPGEVCAQRGITLDQLRRKLRGDLDNVLAMALRKEPHRRYESVEQFSEDLRRHLSGLPIVARKDSFSYRFVKFTDRHRWGLATAIVAFLVLLLTSLFAVQKARRLAHRIEEDHRLATSFLVDIHDSIARLPGAAQARETMLQQSLRYLNGLASDGSSEEFQRPLAQAYEKFAELQIGRNGPGIGKSSEAQATYERARVIREAMAAAHPKDPEVRFELARNYVLGAYIAGRTSIVDVRRNFDQRAVSIAEQLVNENPRSPEYRMVLANACTSLAYGLINEEKWETARTEVRRAMAILSEIAAESPNNSEARQQLAAILYRLGTSYVQSGQPQSGERELREALEWQEQLAAAKPDDPRIRSEMASTHHFLGVALRAQGNLREAGQHLDQAITLRTEALEADPRDGRTRSMLAGNYAERAAVALNAGEHAAALDSASRAVTLQQQVLTADPKSIPIRFSMAQFEGRLASVYQAVAAKSRTHAEYRDAIQWYRQALTHWTELQKEGVLRGPAVITEIDNVRQTLKTLEETVQP